MEPFYQRDVSLFKALAWLFTCMTTLFIVAEALMSVLDLITQNFFQKKGRQPSL